MTGKVIDSGATGFLVLIIPIALIAVVVATAWPILLALLLIIIVWQIVQQWQWQRLVGKVNPAFNQLIQENNGCITPVDLAMKAEIEGNKASQFLEYKATEFSAKSRELPNQGKVYYFLTASAVEAFFDEPESIETIEENDFLEDLEDETNSSSIESFTETEIDSSSSVESKVSQEEESIPVNQELSETSSRNLDVATSQPPSKTTKVSLIQSELARRLMVHSSTVGKRKLDSDFSDWSRQRDPEKIAWKYSKKRRIFYPLDE